MHDGFKIGMSAGAVGAVVGLALQTAQDPMWQTVGQGWMLGGAAGVAVLGGICAVSSKWQGYKQEHDLALAMEKLERHVAWPHSDNVSGHLHAVANQGIGTLMDASENKKTAFMGRMRDISVAWIGGQNTLESHSQASTTALIALAGIAWELNVPRTLQAEDLVYVPKANPASVLDTAQVAKWDVSGVQDMTPVFKPAPIDEKSTSAWTSSSPSMG